MLLFLVAAKSWTALSHLELSHGILLCADDEWQSYYTDDLSNLPSSGTAGGRES